MTFSRQDLSGLVVALLGDAEASAPDLRRRLAESGMPLSPLAFDGLLSGLEVRRLVRGRYAPQSEHDAASPRFYRRGPEAPAAASLRPAA